MKKQIIFGTIGFGMIILFFLIFTSFYTVKTGEVAIISSWGKITRIDKEGLNFKIPIVQTKEMMVTRDKIYSFDNMSVSTKDMQSIVLDLTVQSSVSDPENLYRSFRGLHETSFIIPRTKEVVQASISKYTIEEFVSKRQELSKIIYEDLKDDFHAYGLSVSNVSITNHDFSVEYERAIEAKKVAEQEVERTRFEQEKFRVEAESLSPMLLRKLTIEKWDGKLPQVSGGDNSPIIKLND